VLLVVIVFGRIVMHEFTLWDDRQNFIENERLNTPTWGTVAHYWRWAEHGLYVPVTYMLWTLLAAAGQAYDVATRSYAPNPYVFHAASIFLHACNVLLVFGILRKLIRADIPAARAAAAFAVHPVQVETVAWASGLKDLLCAAGVLGAILLHLHREGKTPSRSRLLLAAATVAYVAAMLSKPIGVVTPLLVLAIDLLVRRRSIRDIWPTVAFWIVLALPVAWIARNVQSGIGVPTVSPPLRALVLTDALAFYLYKLAWPMTLTVDYGRRPHVALEAGWLYWTWVLPLLVGAGLWLLRRRFPVLPAAGVMFVLGMAPVLGAVPFLFQYYSTVADHYLYLPMLGVALAIAALTSTRAARIVVLVLVIAWGVRSILQAGVWQDDKTLWSHATAVSPKSFASNNNMGVVFRLGEQWDIAERYFRRAIEINPNVPRSHDNLAAALIQLGRIDEGISEIEKVIALSAQQPPELRGDLANAHGLLGEYFLATGRPERAVKEIEASLRYRDNPKARELLERARAAAATQPAGQ
jgi:hypothetical protein